MGQQLSLVLHQPVLGNQALVSAAHTADGVRLQVNEPEHAHAHYGCSVACPVLRPHKVLISCLEGKK